MNTVLVIGEGLLADVVYAQLMDQCDYNVTRLTNHNEGIPSTSMSIALVLQDQENLGLLLEMNEKLQQSGIPWISAYLSGEEGFVGPMNWPGASGCFQCADIRMSIAGSNTNATDDMLLMLVNPDYVPRVEPDIEVTGYRFMAQLLVEETSKCVNGHSLCTDSHIYMINMHSLNCTRHYILPHGACPVCGQLEEDSPEAASIVLKPSPKLDNSYRCRSMNELQGVLFNDYWDRRSGLFNDLELHLSSVFADAVVNLPLGYYDEVTGGRSHSFTNSQLAAILEGLERYCGITPRGKRPVVFDSYNQLKEIAMDPATIGLHAQEQYEQEGFPFASFAPDTPIEWVWGYSFLQERPVLVPHLVAYYSLGHEGSFVYETSNGCALGGSLEEAVLYGIFEVVERDAFLMTWYAKLQCPRLDPCSSGDEELILMIQRIKAVLGYEVLLYNITTENGIPSIWSIARGTPEHEVSVVCSAGAHLDPIRAAKSAVHELAGTISMVEKRWKERGSEALSMFMDPYEVQQMEDHTLLYSLPEAAERLHFLLEEQRPVRSFAEEFPTPVVPVSTDVTEELKEVLEVFRRLQLDVIVVDQSSSETLRNGLHCVKVLIPGMLPMTFGHHLRRLEGIDRVLEVPMKLGYVDRKLTREELNPYPHPFP